MRGSRWVRWAGRLVVVDASLPTPLPPPPPPPLPTGALTRLPACVFCLSSLSLSVSLLCVSLPNPKANNRQDHHHWVHYVATSFGSRRPPADLPSAARNERLLELSSILFPTHIPSLLLVAKPLAAGHDHVRRCRGPTRRGRAPSLPTASNHPSCPSVSTPCLPPTHHTFPSPCTHAHRPRPRCVGRPPWPCWPSSLARLSPPCPLPSSSPWAPALRSSAPSPRWNSPTR